MIIFDLNKYLNFTNLTELPINSILNYQFQKRKITKYRSDSKENDRFLLRANFELNLIPKLCLLVICN